MSEIHLMKPELANRIAAGEVIERPASVVKELVENSIDAGAKNVYIGIRDAGKGEILVKDDGKGMDREDAQTCFLRHASSKIRSEFDLSRIHTLGFRGEALPSIASVSRMTLTTSDGSSAGTKVESRPDDPLEVSFAPSRKGTIISVRDLFFNTPARLKYLRSDASETYAIVEMAEHLALGFPSVSIDLAVDGKEVFRTSGRGDLLETIQMLFGNRIAQSLYAFEKDGVAYSFKGYTSKPEIHYSRRNDLLVFLNGRYIYDYKINKAIERAYKDYLPPDRYPFSVVVLSIDPSLVDVNVHPTKKEVRISMEEDIARDLEAVLSQVLRNQRPLYAASEDARTEKDLGLSSASESPFDVQDIVAEEKDKIRKEEEKRNFLSPKEEPLYFQDSMPYPKSFESQGVTPEKQTQEAPLSTAEAKAETKPEEKEETAYRDPEDLLLAQPENPSFPEMHPIGQVLGTYLVCDSESCFYLIDQHAAAERINYEKTEALFENIRSRVVPLVPITVDLSFKELQHDDEEHRARLQRLGIVTEPFGERTLKVTEIPSFLATDEGNVVEDCIHSCLNDEAADPVSLLHLTIANIACKKSIKANHVLSYGEMEGLLRELSHCKNPANCPHGRPTLIQITKDDVEKIFRRSGF